jgi:hypothetical protein
MQGCHFNGLLYLKTTASLCFVYTLLTLLHALNLRNLDMEQGENLQDWVQDGIRCSSSRFQLVDLFMLYIILQHTMGRNVCLPTTHA